MSDPVREALEAILRDVHCTPHMDGRETCLVSAEGAKRIKAHALAALAAQRDADLLEAVRAVYYAAHWSPDRPVDAAGLWTRLRDAAGFPPGESTRLLGAPRDGERGETRNDVELERAAAMTLLVLDNYIALRNNGHERPTDFALVEEAYRRYKSALDSPAPPPVEAVEEALRAFGQTVAKFDPAVFAQHWPTLVQALTQERRT